MVLDDSRLSAGNSIEQPGFDPSLMPVQPQFVLSSLGHLHDLVEVASLVRDSLLISGDRGAGDPSPATHADLHEALTMALEDAEKFLRECRPLLARVSGRTTRNTR